MNEIARAKKKKKTETNAMKVKMHISSVTYLNFS